MLEFDWPWVFLAAPLPALVYFLVPAAKQQLASLKVPFFSQLESMTGQTNQGTNTSSLINMVVLLLIWLLLVSAGARPQWVGEAVSLPPSGRDLLLAVDISGSMETDDMVIQNRQIPRILVVKYIVGEFVERRTSDRLGLILFGSHAYLQAPLTFDRDTVNQLLQEAQIGFAEQKTAIGDAIGLGIKRLRKRPESQRIMILLTDGANTAGEVSPRQAAELAAEEGIKIYTIGLGGYQMSIFGRQESEIDETTLQFIAEKTGGRYFRAHNPKELQEIYALLDELEPIEQEAETFRPISALYYWPLGLALLLSYALSLYYLLPVQKLIGGRQ
ncbi:VWA domain-containing protein [Teredinibacter sp. KSP-S5-2]|uniref:vWA domain-containing protein n=1 Tax=Teredinibacter sp. KSP-S5-2 TaxID=3034506 RepID=UPI002934EFEC|nr:VWA domain-containing protein [Teredinibacter sp. KSP-S5-2]WNO07641.1 VWA domain-containing protein [Teredinibacter sp. KSP-S5-2]